MLPRKSFEESSRIRIWKLLIPPRREVLATTRWWRCDPLSGKEKSICGWRKESVFKNNQFWSRRPHPHGFWSYLYYGPDGCDAINPYTLIRYKQEGTKQVMFSTINATYLTRWKTQGGTRGGRHEDHRHKDLENYTTSQEERLKKQECWGAASLRGNLNCLWAKIVWSLEGLIDHKNYGDGTSPSWRRHEYE